ncbi:hypothetical protein RB195_005830 [Necator americanus]|uniref:Amiloride-sensitive sodium channel n=1 Tax=Necator americanus TaxID=51031 RepID=A0ABR1BRA3_NECAM
MISLRHRSTVLRILATAPCLTPVATSYNVVHPVGAAPSARRHGGWALSAMCDGVRTAEPKPKELKSLYLNKDPCCRDVSGASAIIARKRPSYELVVLIELITAMAFMRERIAPFCAAATIPSYEPEIVAYSTLDAFWINARSPKLNRKEECVAVTNELALNQDLCSDETLAVMKCRLLRYSEMHNGALKWLSKKNSSWSIPHMKANFLTINVFFRDMSYTEYMQVQGTTLTETLSDIGGNMGLFLGMSVITVIEVVMYFSKIGWITISKKRRNYMYQKKANEKEHEKQLEETVNGFRLFRSRKYANDMSHTRARIRALTDKVSSENDAESKSTSERESDATDRRSRFFNENTESYYSDNPERNRNSVVELKINLRDLEHVNNGYMQVQTNYRTRPRSSTAPTYPCFTVGEEE